MAICSASTSFTGRSVAITWGDPPARNAVANRQRSMINDSVLRDGNDPPTERPATITDGTNVLVDAIGSLENLGLIRRAGTGFQLRVKAMVGYPADPGDNQKVLQPPAKQKYGFVAIVHGQSIAWEFGTAATPTPKITGSGLPVRTVPVTDREDYKGYAYLQTHLAQLPKPIVSISFSYLWPNLLSSVVEMRSQLLLAAFDVLLDSADGREARLHPNSLTLLQRVCLSLPPNVS